ncbi:MAG: response regulator [Ignavibacteriae bacterium]|nr:response regulator [Ignavibacteriota bacterium]
MGDMRKVLLVEDSPMDAELILEGFTQLRLANDVVHVRDGVEALEYLRRQGQYTNRESGDPVVVLLDVKMPRMDGIETLAAIRGDAALRYIRVVMLTSSSQEEDILRSYKLGADAFVVKPVRYQKFMEAVQAIGLFWAIVNERPPDILYR